MPIYRYRCSKCGDEFEEQQSIKDVPLDECWNVLDVGEDEESVTFTTCGGELKKVIQPVSVAFKGSGFHSTDYAKKDNSFRFKR